MNFAAIVLFSAAIAAWFDKLPGRLLDGVVFYLLIRGTVFLIKYILTRAERMYAIYMHWINRVYGRGHATDSVLVCGQGACSVFNA